jgi:hypothetical protein
MTDIETQVSAALAEALDTDLAEQIAAVDTANVLNKLTPHLGVTHEKLLALGRGEADLPAPKLAERLDLDPADVQAFMDGSEELIEIDEAAVHGFNDVFGLPKDTR